MNQELVTIINIKRSTPTLTFEYTVFKSTYEKLLAAGKLKDCVLKSDIEKIETVVIEDGLGKNIVEIVEAKEELEILDNYDILTVDELKELCTAKGLKFHHMAKENKLIEILRGNNA